MKKIDIYDGLAILVIASSIGLAFYTRDLKIVLTSSFGCGIGIILLLRGRIPNRIFTPIAIIYTAVFFIIYMYLVYWMK
ncbi:hypothetical protein [Pedobacter miscanthi]|jgi:hypothetical protein|uniref:hypothetical protein n=1 Tax=Pedobacter miscanthi TaxID=2259170 RepID=UPI002931AD54|nr:hypothetical protein [Pedobacter miscanthi]